MIELTITQATKHSADFMYLWASNSFLNCLRKQYALIIRVKRANMNKLIELSAEKYHSTADTYKSAIRSAFIKAYGMTPEKALDVLAKGGNVAGKNWNKGVFGVGKLKSTTFEGSSENGQKITCDPNTGDIYVGGNNITDSSLTVRMDQGGTSVDYQKVGKGASGVTYMSQRGSDGKYYAYAVGLGDGNMYNVSSGKQVQMTEEDNAAVWSSVALGLSQFLEWLINLFGSGTNKQTLNTQNTMPNQRIDGFTSESGWSWIPALLLVAAAGGMIAMGGFRTGNKRK